MKITYSCVKSTILYYSVFLSTIIVVGGLITIKTGTDIVVNALFLPIVIYFWMELIEKRKLQKKLFVKKDDVSSLPLPKK